MKEATKDAIKAGVDKGQFAWSETKEVLLSSDKPNIKPEEIPTNLRFQEKQQNKCKIWNG